MEGPDTVVEENQIDKQLDEIVPRKEHREQIVGRPDGIHEVYVQRPLSFIGKMRMSSILGRALNRAMSGGGGKALASLFGSSEEELTDAVKDGKSPLTKEDLDTTAIFMQAIGVVMEYVPDILLDVYVVSLNVPEGEQEWAKETMSLMPDEGGLTDEDGMAILNTFLDQNWDALQSFFVDQILPLMGRFRADPSQQPKPSRATRRATQRQSKSSSHGPGGASK